MRPTRPLHHTPKADMEGALRALRSLVDQGIEYPDAHCRVIARFGLSTTDADRLGELYLEPAEDDQR